MALDMLPVNSLPAVAADAGGFKKQKVGSNWVL